MINIKKHMTGFTLIELMIVVTIVAILALVAYPSYQNHVIKTRRVDAEGNLLELSQFMERYFTEVGNYCGETPPNDPCTTDPALPFTKSPKEGNITFYNISFIAGEPTPTTYTLQAVPVGSQLTGDTDCGTVSVNSVGVKCTAGGTHCSDGSATDRAAIDDCW